MKKTSNFLTVSIVLAVLLPGQLLSAVRQRADIPAKYKWNLNDLYSSDESWTASMQKAVAQFDKVLQYKGKLANSAQLLACLEFQSDLSKEFDRLYSYAAMQSDQDTRQSKPLGMRQQLEQYITDFNSKASFIDPEVARMDKQKIDDFIVEEPKLKIYRMYLYNILRTKAHRLSEKEEKILAEVSLLANSPESIYSILSNAELPYPDIELSDGSTVTLNSAGYGRYRSSPNRADREKVFNAFWKTWSDFKKTFGIQLYSNIKKDMFYARVRNYNSSLESSLNRNNIPTKVYTTLIENVHNNLDTFHRYLRLKKRMLGVDQLKYSDLYAPVVKGIDLEYKYEKACQLIVDSLQPLGKDYTKVAKKCFESRWIDVYPNLGKNSGAYSNGGVYDVHPYILMNYNDKYTDVSTLTHELGHTMHSYYSNKTQPYPTAGYSIFVAV